eukprot:2179605-Prymnesium_polylepis.1
MLAWGRTAHVTARLIATPWARVGAARTRWRLTLACGSTAHGTAPLRRCSQGMDGRGSLSLAGA